MIQKEIGVNTSHTFEFQFYRNGLQIVPASATVTIYSNSGTSLSTGSATIDTSGDVTYTFLYTANTTVERNFKIKVSYVYAGVTTVEYHLFDVVMTPLVNAVTDDDLFAYLGDLRDRVKERTTEVSTTGSTTGITCYDLKADSRDYTGGYLQLFIAPADDCGVTETHEARITAYDKTTGSITFTPAYSTAVASGTTVSIRPSYQNIIDRAWLDHVMRDVRAIVGPAAGYIDSNTTKLPTITKALSIYCFSQSEEDNDKWARRATKYEDEYRSEMQRIKAAYDQDEDGNISEAEETYKPSVSWVDFSR